MAHEGDGPASLLHRKFFCKGKLIHLGVVAEKS